MSMWNDDMAEERRQKAGYTEINYATGEIQMRMADGSMQNLSDIGDYPMDTGVSDAVAMQNMSPAAAQIDEQRLSEITDQVASLVSRGTPPEEIASKFPDIDQRVINQIVQRELQQRDLSAMDNTISGQQSQQVQGQQEVAPWLQTVMGMFSAIGGAAFGYNLSQDRETQHAIASAGSCLSTNCFGVEDMGRGQTTAALDRALERNLNLNLPDLSIGGRGASLRI